MAGKNRAEKKESLFMEEDFDLLPDDEDDGYEPLEGPSETQSVYADAGTAAQSGDAAEDDEDEPAVKAPGLERPTQKTGPLSGLFRFNYEDGSEQHLNALFSEESGKSKAPEKDTVQEAAANAAAERKSVQGKKPVSNTDESGSEDSDMEAADLSIEDEENTAAAGAYAADDRSLSMAGYLGYMLLYCIPVAGVIVMLIFAFTAKNRHLRTFTRAFLCFMIIILLAVTEMSLLGWAKYLY